MVLCSTLLHTVLSDGCHIKLLNGVTKKLLYSAKNLLRVKLKSPKSCEILPNKHVLSTMGLSKESISKFLIGNWFHIKLHILSPENCKQSLQVKSWKAEVTGEKKQTQDYNQNFVIQAHKSWHLNKWLTSRILMTSWNYTIIEMHTWAYKRNEKVRF